MKESESEEGKYLDKKKKKHNLINRQAHQNIWIVLLCANAQGLEGYLLNIVNSEKTGGEKLSLP